MTSDVRAADIVMQWRELREQGQYVAPEELCEDCPELLDEVRAQIDALEPMQQTVEPTETYRTDATVVRVESQYDSLLPQGRGGIGEVFTAQDESLNRTVVLKFLQQRGRDDSQAHDDLTDEAVITGQLEHPGVVPVYGMGQTDAGRPCYVMRYIRGRTLGDEIERFHFESRDDQAAFQRLLQHFVATCRTAAYAHSRGVVHLDIKPSNIMVGKYGETVLVDWGLAASVQRCRRHPESNDEVTVQRPQGSSSSQRRGLGTIGYMSPEQLGTGTTEVGPASDVYGLGGTLYRLLTNKSSIPEADYSRAMERIRHGEIRPVRALNPAVPRPLEAICTKAMARRPADRYASALDLAEDVECWLADTPVSAYRERPVELLARWLRHHRSWAMALALVVVVVVVAALGSAVIMRSTARRELAAVQLARAEREQRLRGDARLAATLMESEIALRYSILHREAANPELHALIEQCLQLPENLTLAQPPIREMQNHLNRLFFKYMEGQSEGSVSHLYSSLFFVDRRGYLLARSPEKHKTRQIIGKSFAFRDYFHGGGLDLESDTAAVEPIQHPYRCTVFASKADDTLRIAFVVPIRAGAEVLGILGMSVKVSTFESLDSLGERTVVLIDRRPVRLEPTQTPVPGVLIHHPRVTNVQADSLPAVAASVLDELDELAHPGRENRTGFRADYVDPVVDRSQFVAFAPVFVKTENEVGELTLVDTKLAVLVQDPLGDTEQTGSGK